MTYQNTNLSFIWWCIFSGLTMAKQHSGGVYEKAKSFAVTKGLVNDDKTAKKEE